jgi:hypothetical protein
MNTKADRPAGDRPAMSAERAVWLERYTSHRYGRLWWRDT